jgi:hypothetical protein
MIFDANGNLYFADLEQKPLPKWILQEQLPLVKGEKVRWADSFLVSIITYYIIQL